MYEKNLCIDIVVQYLNLSRVPIIFFPRRTKFSGSKLCPQQENVEKSRETTKTRKGSKLSKETQDKGVITKDY